MTIDKDTAIPYVLAPAHNRFDMLPLRPIAQNQEAARFHLAADFFNRLARTFPIEMLIMVISEPGLSDKERYHALARLSGGVLSRMHQAMRGLPVEQQAGLLKQSINLQKKFLARAILPAIPGGPPQAPDAKTLGIIAHAISGFRSPERMLTYLQQRNLVLSDDEIKTIACGLISELGALTGHSIGRASSLIRGFSSRYMPPQLRSDIASHLVSHVIKLAHNPPVQHQILNYVARTISDLPPNFRAQPLRVTSEQLKSLRYLTGTRTIRTTMLSNLLQQLPHVPLDQRLELMNTLARQSRYLDGLGQRDALKRFLETQRAGPEVSNQQRGLIQVFELWVSAQRLPVIRDIQQIGLIAGQIIRALPGLPPDQKMPALAGLAFARHKVTNSTMLTHFDNALEAALADPLTREEDAAALLGIMAESAEQESSLTTSAANAELTGIWGRQPETRRSAALTSQLVKLGTIEMEDTMPMRSFILTEMHRLSGQLLFQPLEAALSRIPFCPNDRQTWILSILTEHIPRLPPTLASKTLTSMLTRLGTIRMANTMEIRQLVRTEMSKLSGNLLRQPLQAMVTRFATYEFGLQDWAATMLINEIPRLPPPLAGAMQGLMETNIGRIPLHAMLQARVNQFFSMPL